MEGLYGKPTIVNNVETISNMTWIVENGVAAYAAIGTEGSAGTRLFSLSCHVRKPGNYEIIMGMTFGVFIEDYGGGVRYDRAVKWMEENKPEDEELRRFRAEAAELLKIEDGDEA
mgnify:CR=1 FL=1